MSATEAFEKFWTFGKGNNSAYIPSDIEVFDAGYKAGMEAAARICDKNAEEDSGDDPREFAAQQCAEAIRKLNKE